MEDVKNESQKRDRKDVQRFVDSAKAFSSSRTLRDIYELSTSLHANEKACIYFDEDGKKQSYTYAQYKTPLLLFGPPPLERPQRHSSRGSRRPQTQETARAGLFFSGRDSWVGIRCFSSTPNWLTRTPKTFLKQSQAKAILVNEEDPYSVPSFRLNEIKNAEDDPLLRPPLGQSGDFLLERHDGRCQDDGHRWRSLLLSSRRRPQYAARNPRYSP
jgi:hypothetical protein